MKRAWTLARSRHHRPAAGSRCAVDAADNRGRTALIIAAELGYAPTVDLLLKRGADRTLKDREGKTALDLAKNTEVRERLAAH